MFIDIGYDLYTDTLGAKSTLPCDLDISMKYDTCVYSVISDKMHEEFGCIVPFVYRMQAGRKVCRFDLSTQGGLKFKEQVMRRYDFLSSSGKNMLVVAVSSWKTSKS